MIASGGDKKDGISGFQEKKRPLLVESLARISELGENSAGATGCPSGSLN
jgi:hypothetical protein